MKKEISNKIEPPYKDNLAAAHAEIKVLKDELAKYEASENSVAAIDEIHEGNIVRLFIILMNNVKWEYKNNNDNDIYVTKLNNKEIIIWDAWPYTYDMKIEKYNNKGKKEDEAWFKKFPLGRKKFKLLRKHAAKCAKRNKQNSLIARKNNIVSEIVETLTLKK
jgi:hypothetical protein